MLLEDDDDDDDDGDDEGEDKMTLPINSMRVAVENDERPFVVVPVDDVDVVCAARDRFLLPLLLPLQHCRCCCAVVAAAVACRLLLTSPVDIVRYQVLLMRLRYIEDGIVFGLLLLSMIGFVIPFLSK